MITPEAQALREKVYDAEIAPLMKRIAEVCQRNGIPMVATFDISRRGQPGLACSTVVHPHEGPKAMRDAIAVLLRGSA